MARVKAPDFKAEHLKLGDVWTWSNDLRQSEDCIVTVPLTEEALSGADSLLVHANFQTAQGDALRGLVVYSMGSTDVFAVEILSGDLTFTLNRFARELSQAELNRLAVHVNREAHRLLPMTFEIVPKHLVIAPGSFSP